MNLSPTESQLRSMRAEIRKMKTWRLSQSATQCRRMAEMINGMRAKSRRVRLIDMMRPLVLSMGFGARIVPLTTANVSFARVATDSALVKDGDYVREMILEVLALRDLFRAELKRRAATR